jgi:hypothetical protein
MTPRAEVLTMTKKGLADFLMELKRTQIRAQTPFDKFMRKVRKDRDSKVRAWSLEPADVQQDRYARQVDKWVAVWEQQQQKSADNVRNAPPPTDSEDIGGLIEWQRRERDAQRYERRFHSIRTYLGDLNRDINEARVMAYGTAMEQGDWWFTPDPVVVTDEGAIINGQHRLLAVERVLADELTDADAPSFVVVWGVDKRAAILMDEARRSATDRRDIALRYARSSRG